MYVPIVFNILGTISFGNSIIEAFHNSMVVFFKNLKIVVFCD
jgi:hypothetical protein